MSEVCTCEFPSVLCAIHHYESTKKPVIHTMKSIFHISWKLHFLSTQSNQIADSHLFTYHRLKIYLAITKSFFLTSKKTARGHTEQPLRFLPRVPISPPTERQHELKLWFRKGSNKDDRIMAFIKNIHTWIRKNSNKVMIRLPALNVEQQNKH